MTGIIMLAIFLIWLTPIILVAQSTRVSGKEKIAWLLAIVVISWIAWFFYLLLAPLKNSNYRCVYMLKKLSNVFKFVKKRPKNWKPKRVSSSGDISELFIQNTIPYFEALNKIKSELINSGITIDLASFYTESPVKLHNYSNEITYNFVTVDGKRVIAYEIAWRKIEGTTYYEVDYDGNVIFSCGTYGCPKSSPGYKIHVENMRRIFSTIGEYAYYMEINT